MVDSVDVLLATYNGGEHIEALLHSITNNTCNINFIIRDDKSTDNTLEIIEKFSLKNEVKVIEDSLGRLGVINNFGSLLKHSTSDYVLFSDQDDIWLGSKVDSQLEKLKEMEKLYGKNVPLLVFTDSTTVDNNLNTISQSFWRSEELNPLFCHSFKKLIIQNVAQGCTMIFNQALIKKALPFPDNIIMHDWWLMLVASCFGKVSFLDTQTLLYRQHQNNEVGAQGFEIIRSFNRFVWSREQLVNSIHKTQVQANSFLKCYRDELDEQDLRYLNQYVVLSEKNFIKRKIFCLSNKIHKTNFLRTLGFYFLI